jgi:cytochrome P450
MTADANRLIDPEFWHQPLEDRMSEMIAIRELGAFVPIEFDNELSGERDRINVTLRHAEVQEVSKRAVDFCSSRGATSIIDLPTELLEFFTGFINMDNPRHAQQRRIVAHTFTPSELTGVIDQVGTLCTEVVDGFCEQGTVDLVEVLSQPFPLLVICDMMGIPRSEVKTVLDATNVILGGGDPEYIKPDEDPIAALIAAGMSLTNLMTELIEFKRENPADDLTTKLVHNTTEDGVLTPGEIASFFILLATAGNDTTRNAISHGMDLLSKNPDQRRIWQEDVANGDASGVTTTAVEEIVRLSSPVTFMRRTATGDVSVGDTAFHDGDKIVMIYVGANRDPRVFAEPERMDVRRDPNPHVGFGGPGPHFCLGAHLARREVALVFGELFRRLPDIEVSAPSTPLQTAGLPLVAGIKHLPVTFTPSAPVGA